VDAVASDAGGHRPSLARYVVALDRTTRMLSPFLDRLTDEELDALPYGVVQIDADGRILTYNRAEAEDTGFTLQRPIGRDYFSDVAPSAFVVEVFGRYVEAFTSRFLDERFRFTFSHDMMPRTVQIRMFYSARTGTVWLFMANPDGSPLAKAA
jgi:photoactive yellow protein